MAHVSNLLENHCESWHAYYRTGLRELVKEKGSALALTQLHCKNLKEQRKELKHHVCIFSELWVSGSFWEKKREKNEEKLLDDWEYMKIIHAKSL